MKARLISSALVIVADQVTKQLAVKYLWPPHIPHEIIGDFVRFTLAFNPGAAFSMSIGSYSRYLFGAFSVIACYALWRSRGAEFITEPKEKYGETRCYIRDPDGYLIEVGQSKPDVAYG